MRLTHRRCQKDTFDVALRFGITFIDGYQHANPPHQLTALRARRDRPRRRAAEQRDELAPSLDHLVGAAGERQRDSDAERLGGLQIQEEFDFGGLLNRQIGRLVALENSRRTRRPDGSIPFRCCRSSSSHRRRRTREIRRSRAFRDEPSIWPVLRCEK
jgi:hypothetical protein